MRWLILVVVVAVTASSAAANRKVLVLPLDGTADAATRTKLTADIARLTRGQGGQVTTGNATFSETALAVGCDPQAPGCSDEVIATLGVDELVWGTATRDGGQVRLVVRRAAKGGAVREASTTIAAGESGERVTAGIAPLFAPGPAASEPAPTGTTTTTTAPPDSTSAAAGVPPASSGDTALPPAGPGPADDRRDRTIGISLAAGGGVGLVLGFALWASYASLQSSIDHHAIGSQADLQDLKSLEDRAGTRAFAGDFFVLAGLAAAGAGGYYLYRDHKRHAIAIAPAPIAHGGGVTITLLGGL